MSRRRSIVFLLFLIFAESAVLLSACDEPREPLTGPSSPSPSLASAADVWNITVWLATAAGGECAGDTMNSQLGVPRNYRLSISPKGSSVTLRSASGDYACTFPATIGSDGFTTFGVHGWYSCETSLVVRDFVCTNGTPRDLMQLGQNISGHISGNEIAGEWHVSWVVMHTGGRDDIAALDTTAHYTGTRWLGAVAGDLH